MNIYRSRFTPNIKGSQTYFEIGEKVTYQSPDGKAEQVAINSDLLTHKGTASGLYYEAICADGKLRAIDPDRIVNWEGKNHPTFYGDIKSN
jgi:hypothetical protein